MISRRALIQALVAAAVGAAGGLAPVSLGARTIPWRNWSGSQLCYPASRVAPSSVEALREVIAGSAGTLRPVGAGHSFTALVPTDDTIISLSRLSGIVDADRESLQATLWAGTRLGDLGQPLETIGQALINMPDIDDQSLAGCLATATHGTGAGIGCMPDYVEALQLVDGRGELVNCSRDSNSDIFSAAQVSLGALGVITQVRLQNIAPYRLRRETVWHTFEDILVMADDMADRHRNFEFYVLPFSGMGYTDIHDITEEPFGSSSKIDPNQGVMDLKLARDWLQDYPKVRELILGSYMRTIGDEIAVERSWKNYASERNVRFNEMEYHLPRESGLRALREIKETLESGHREVFFPIEVRFVKGDDIWLSPFNGRDSISIAVHRYFEEDYKPFFAAIEPIFRKYGGRPHWGKLNTLTGDDFLELYPDWERFKAVRSDMDPQNKFLNPYLAGLFGQSPKGDTRSS